MPTRFEDSDELLEAYLAESGEADLGEAPVSRLWADGREVGEWTVTGFLARGGSAEVYCVKHRRLGTRAAMKVLWRDGTGPEERFRKESLFLMEDPGPSFPAFYGAGVEDGHPWVAMELLDECPMPSSDREVARYLLDIGGGVAALHARGWLHRDLKPRNILRRVDGHAVLADFGLLKAIGEDEMAVVGDSPSIVDGREVGVGTPGFSAPEQFSGGGATPAADVYAMGMLAEECFGGNPPRVWEKIIRRATAALPRQRYPDVEPMLRAIRLRHWSRNWLWALLAGLGIALLAAAWAIRTIRTDQEEMSIAAQAEPPPRATEPDGEVAVKTEPPPPQEPVPEPVPAVEPEPILSEPLSNLQVEAEPLLEEPKQENEPPVQTESPPREEEKKPVASGATEEMIQKAKQARAAAVRRASEGPRRAVVDGILKDMVILKGAENLANTFRKDFGFPSGSVLIGRHEVTQVQWLALMDGNPSRFKGADRPVDGVSIGDCMEFIGRLNRMPNVREAGLRFRLLTTEEWMYAVQDDFAMAWAGFAEPKSGWFAHNSGNKTHPVGQQTPNELGLYDLYGNVAELVFDVKKLKRIGVSGMVCQGGSCNQSADEITEDPLYLFSLGREIETLPEEWQPIARSTGIPVQLPEAVANADLQTVRDYFGSGPIGLRLCADNVRKKRVEKGEGL